MSDIALLRVPEPAAAASEGQTLLEAQRDVLELIVRGRPLREILAALCTIVDTLSGPGSVAAILLLDSTGTRLHTGAAPGLPADYVAAIDGIGISPTLGTCCRAAATGEVVITRDIAHDRGWEGLAHLPLAVGLQAAWSMPIVSSAGQVLGTFGTYFEDRREPAPEERHLVEVLSRTAALAIERQREDQRLEASERRHRFLSELQATTQSIGDPVEVMRHTAAMLARHLDADRCAYAEIDDESVFVITGEALRGTPSILGRWPVELFGAACVRSLRDGEPFVVDDVDRDPRIGPADLPAYRATTIGAVICVPLHKDGRFSAAMAVHQLRPRAWTREEIDLVAVVVARCWEALERARIARTLRDSEARYRAIVDASPECVKLVAPDGTLLHMNPAGLAMIEARDGTEAIGRSIYDVIASEHRAAFREFNERICAGESGLLEFDIVGLRGGRRSMVTTGVPLPGADGRLVQLGMSRDVTRAMQAERAIQDSRSRLDYAVRLSGVGFWYCDLPFDQLMWDARVRDHFFLDGDERVTIDVFYERIHPEDRAPTREAIERSIDGTLPYDIVYRTVNPRDGTLKWIRALGGAIYAPDGSPRRFDGVTVDVTAQRLDQARLADLNEQLREQDRRKDEFLATLAHELRNPLAPIRTGIEILKPGTPAHLQERVREMMERQMRHLVRMVDDLLDISRITLDKVTLQLEPLDFRSVLNGALETARPLVEERKHRLTVDLPPAPVPLLGDATRLAQVFANLLNNAARYTPPGGHIEVAAAVRDGVLVTTVTDDGVGIPADMLSRVFERFAQVPRGDADTMQGGLGLGLTLVMRLVAMHGGRVHAESEGIGRGSRFTVELPLP